MADTNLVVISGRVPEKPKQLGSDKGPVVMRVSVGERRKDKESGEFKMFWNSLDVIVWNDKPDVLALEEGARVVVTGKIVRESYMKGEERIWQTRIKADSVNLALAGITTIDPEQEKELATVGW